MTMNEDVIQMRTQILNLRTAALACASAMRHFPPCCKPGWDPFHSSIQPTKMQRIYQGMKDLLLSARIVSKAAMVTDPVAWDIIWELHEDSSCTERDLASLGERIYSDLDEFFKLCGEMDHITRDEAGRTFHEREMEVLTAEEAWQNGRRLPQVLHLLEYLEDQIVRQLDEFYTEIDSGLLGDCANWATGLRKRRQQSPKE